MFNDTLTFIVVNFRCSGSCNCANLVHLILWLPLQRLKHAEHVEGELGELHLVRNVPHNYHLQQNKIIWGCLFSISYPQG